MKYVCRISIGLLSGFLLVACSGDGAQMAKNDQMTINSRVKLQADRPKIVAQGKDIYLRDCASCHGASLAGQEDWKIRNPEGLLPAPPHDDSGHTWHHPDQMLFDMTKYGVQKFAGADYESTMPAYGDTLSDAEIIAVLSYIKSRWPDNIKKRHDGLNKQYERVSP